MKNCENYGMKSGVGKHVACVGVGDKKREEEKWRRNTLANIQRQ